MDIIPTAVSLQPLRNIGDVYVRLGEMAKARRAYERAIAVSTEMLAVNILRE